MVGPITRFHAEGDPDVKDDMQLYHHLISPVFFLLNFMNTIR